LQIGEHTGKPSAYAQDIKRIYRTDTLDGRLTLIKVIV